MKNKNMAQKINQSASFAEIKEDILLLAGQAGMKDTISSVFKSADTNYEIGMAVAKVFDTFGIVPTMSWLPEEIKAMYRTKE